MLIKGFLSEVLEKLNDTQLKNFLLDKLESQINGH